MRFGPAASLSHNLTDTQIYINGYTTLAIFVNYEQEPWAEVTFHNDDGQQQRKYQLDNGVPTGNCTNTIFSNLNLFNS